MNAWIVKLLPNEAEEHWPSMWSARIVPDRTILFCPIFTTKRDAQSYRDTFDSAVVIEFTLP